MYGIEYEDDILLLLRMIKFLHMQSPDAAHIFCQSHPVVDMEELLMVIDEVMWDIFDDVNFFFDEEYEATVVQCSHPIIDRLYEQGRASDPKHGSRQSVWSKKLHDMLAHLTLLPKHGENLLERGLSEERIRRNEYRSMPETERGRRLLTDLLRSHGHDLHGIPGFRTYYGDWTLSGPNGFLIPVRNKDGLIQGLKIRLDDAQQANRKYRWLSSRNLPSGTRSYSWVHVTGNTQSKRAFLTEGPLKGDVASFLAQDALSICIGGVNALNGLNDTVRELGVREVVEAMDMDQMTNPNVRKAILTMRKEVRKIPGIRYSKYTWNPAYKGVDDYLLSQAATM